MLSRNFLHSRRFAFYSYLQFVHEEALAYELAAYFYLELGEVDKALEYFMLAHERYHEWVSSKVNSFHICDIIC